MHLLDVCDLFYTMGFDVLVSKNSITNYLHTPRAVGTIVRPEVAVAMQCAPVHHDS